jgi:HAD superfamily hydrolase (TIGR01549 family)
MRIKALFFDFDGVIKESSKVKTDAFRALYREFGEEVAEAVVQFHINHGGISRYEKIKHCHQVLLNIDLSDEELENWASKFSDLVLQAVIECDYVGGAEKTIESLKKKYLLFIITGTPQSEIEYIVDKIGLNSAFIAVCGAPKHKDSLAFEIMEKHGLLAKEIIFIGDAMTDYNAAIKLNLNFVLREHAENKKQFAKKEVVKIQDLTNFQTVIQTFEQK